MNHSLASSQQVYPDGFKTAPNEDEADTHRQLNIAHRVPAFLRKLYIMVEDSTIDAFVRWSESGNSFLVEEPEGFAKKILPRFFKHNTFSSFIRQLNMYHFHKIPYFSQDSHREIYEYTAPFFKKGRPELLVYANRKKNRTTTVKDNNNNELRQLSPSPDNYQNVIEQVKSIEKEQKLIESELSNLRKDNKILWEEMLASKESYHRHEKEIFKILHFLTILTSSINLPEKSIESNSKKPCSDKLFLYSTPPSKSRVNYGNYNYPTSNNNNTVNSFDNAENNNNNNGFSMYCIDQLQHNAEILMSQLGTDLKDIAYNNSMVTENFFPNT